jgi:glycosyltransferase involved in cell wall biosynthesis
MTLNAAKPSTRPKISIILATLNPGPKVEATLESIFAQRRDMFELIVADGDSTDGTRESLNKYPETLTLISGQASGIYDAFNNAIDIATGEYIYFIGAGDILRPGILEKMQPLLGSTEPTIVYGNCYLVQQQIVDGRPFDAITFARSNICHQGMFFHHSVFTIAGKFDSRYKVFADWFFNARCFLNKEISTKYVNQIIADYEEGGMSSQIDGDIQFLKDFPLFIRENFGVRKYLECRALLKNELLFILVSPAPIRGLTGYLIAKYTLGRFASSIPAPLLKRLRRFVSNNPHAAD